MAFAGAEWFGAALYHVNIIACKIRYYFIVLQTSERVFGGFLDSLRSLEMTEGRWHKRTKKQVSVAIRAVKSRKKHRNLNIVSILLRKSGKAHKSWRFVAKAAPGKQKPHKSRRFVAKAAPDKQKPHKSRRSVSIGRKDPAGQAPG